MLKVKEVERKAFDIEELAAYYSVSPDFVRRRIESKEIPSYKLGKLVRVKKDDADDFFEKCKRT